MKLQESFYYHRKPITISISIGVNGFIRPYSRGVEGVKSSVFVPRVTLFVFGVCVFIGDVGTHSRTTPPSRWKL